MNFFLIYMLLMQFSFNLMVLKYCDNYSSVNICWTVAF